MGELVSRNCSVEEFEDNFIIEEFTKEGVAFSTDKVQEAMRAGDEEGMRPYLHKPVFKKLRRWMKEGKPVRSRPIDVIDVQQRVEEAERIARGEREEMEQQQQRDELQQKMMKEAVEMLQNAKEEEERRTEQ